jgi:RNA polymerase-binding transcription factor DksA
MNVARDPAQSRNEAANALGDRPTSKGRNGMPRKQRKEEPRQQRAADPGATQRGAGKHSAAQSASRDVGAEDVDVDVDVGEFEGLLTQRQKALWSDIQRELEKSRGQQFKDLIQQGADPDDRAIADLLTTMNASEVTRDVEEFRAVLMALGRIHSGSYGICLNC